MGWKRKEGIRKEDSLYLIVALPYKKTTTLKTAMVCLCLGPFYSFVMFSFSWKTREIYRGTTEKVLMAEEFI